MKNVYSSGNKLRIGNKTWGYNYTVFSVTALKIPFYKDKKNAIINGLD